MNLIGKINTKQNILEKMFEICKEENINSKIFRSKNYASETRKKIREEYIRMMSDFFSNISTGMETKNKTEQIMEEMELVFEGIFRNFLKSIRERYPKKFWEVKIKWKKQREKKFQQKNKVL